MQVLVRIILAVAILWHPVFGLAGAAAMAAVKACAMGPSCCCGGDGACPMSATSLRCDCGGDQPAPVAPVSNDKRDGVERALALVPATVVVPAPIVVLARPSAEVAAPARVGPSFQAILCVWLT